MYQKSRCCTWVTVLFVDPKVPVGFRCNISDIPVDLFDTASLPVTEENVCNAAKLLL